MLNDYLENELIMIDENHYNVMKELNIAKREKDQLEIELKDYTKPIIYCEGTTDVTIFQKAFLKLYEKDFFDNCVNLIGGGGEGEVGNKLKNNKSDKCLIGILDNDIAGQNQFKKVIKDHSFKLKDGTYCVNSNNHLITLPIPEFRLKSASYFERKTFIEYLFTDETLNDKLEIELIQYRGETFKRFDETKIDSIKQKISKKIELLEKKDFEHFIPLFEKIAGIIEFELPTVDFNA